MNSNYRYICRGLYVPNLSNLKHAILALFLEKVGSYFFQAILILCLRSMEPKKVNGYHKCRHLRRNLDSWDPRRVIQVLETAPCNRRSILRIGLAALGQRLQYLGDENKLYGLQFQLLGNFWFNVVDVKGSIHHPACKITICDPG